MGLLYWFSSLVAEKKLQGYIERLEKRGYTIEEHSLSDFHIDFSIINLFFSDFTFEADYQGIDRIYLDRKIHALYFLNADKEDRVEANIFDYKCARSE
jgi:hypothetical protein